ncbi:uncharacterized protein LOC121858534 isoform X2 [Homarus americanus]|uniref:uncharacterized protein LOC121858534 isoform X2 n=1 Tax=Homarus americanus TaxID=6706 RepID=UPI001C47A413|nr:uncharacterized protein LOC121858534 isoform X2 [Homarus americanus]
MSGQHHYQTTPRRRRRTIMFLVLLARMMLVSTTGCVETLGSRPSVSQSVKRLLTNPTRVSFRLHPHEPLESFTLKLSLSYTYNNDNDSSNELSSYSDDSSSDSVKEFSSDSVNDPSSDSVNHPFSDSVNDPFSDSVNDPSSDSVNHPSSDSVDDPFNDSVNDPSSESVNDPFSDSVNDLSSDSVDDPFSDSVNDPFSDSVNYPSSDSVNDPSSDSVNDPFNDSVNNPSSDFVNAPFSDSVNYPSSDSVNDPSSDSVNDLSSHSVKQDNYLLLVFTAYHNDNTTVVFDLQMTMMDASNQTTTRRRLPSLLRLTRSGWTTLILTRMPPVGLEVSGEDDGVCWHLHLPGSAKPLLDWWVESPPRSYLLLNNNCISTDSRDSGVHVTINDPGCQHRSSCSETVNDLSCQCTSLFVAALLVFFVLLVTVIGVLMRSKRQSGSRSPQHASDNVYNHHPGQRMSLERYWL